MSNLGNPIAARALSFSPLDQFRGHHPYFAETLHFLRSLRRGETRSRLFSSGWSNSSSRGRWSPVNVPSRCDRSIHGGRDAGPHSLKRKTTDHTDATDEKDLHCDPSMPIRAVRGPFFPPCGGRRKEAGGEERRGLVTAEGCWTGGFWGRRWARGWTRACQYACFVPHDWGGRARIDRRKALGGKGLMGRVGPDLQGKRRGEILARNGFLRWDASGCGVGT